ncbi:unnamed protein product [Miscanthus lutarioriparius]|uniref:Uncharacterized protein n=1 Tax=Miscanthus lutarioriparius TaxID=422564 RepID=A0A811MFI2_9POAL|nr:unnamed protein product [Miscanthus lutarioriparius]
MGYQSKSIDGDVTAPMMLHGRVAIVTGGTGGIGSAVSKHLASLGARVAVAYIGDPAPALELVSTINKNSSSAGHAGAGEEGESQQPRAVAVEADVSDAAQVRALFDAAEAAFCGELHILVTAAGLLDFSYPTLAETSEASYDAMFGTNARGTFLCCREAARRPRPHHHLLLVGGRVAAPGLRGVRSEQGGGGGDDQDPGARAARHRDHRQRGGAGVHGHAHVLHRQDGGGGGAVHRGGAAGKARHARGYRAAGWLPRQRRWPLVECPGSALQRWHHLAFHDACDCIVYLFFKK